jgi:hypothetical protein
MYYDDFVKQGEPRLSIQIALLIAITGILQLSIVDSYPQWDEIYHILAARSWAENGTLAIGEGEYRRGAGLTILIGFLFSIFGESLFVAKVPSLVAGLLLVLSIFLWVRANWGTAAGWFAALLFAFHSESLAYAQYIRFYSLMPLAFFLFAIICHRIATRPSSLAEKVLLSAAALCCLIAALHLQIVVIIGLLSVGLWLGLLLGSRLVQWWTGRWQWYWLAAIAGIALLGLAGALILFDDFLIYMADRFQSNSGWASGERENPLYYHVVFLRHLPTFWTLVPLAALVAIRKNPSAGLLCLTIVAVSFLLVSAAAQKHIRYFSFAIPFLFALWGPAIAAVVPVIRRMTDDLIDRILPGIGAAGRGPRLSARWGLIGLLFFGILAANLTYSETLARIFDLAEGRRNTQGWEAAAERLDPVIDQVDVILTTSDLFSLYYFGKYDIMISRSVLAETREERDFAEDYRTGRFVVGSAAAVDLILTCYRTGIFIGDRDLHWRDAANGADNETADLIVARTEPIAIPSDWRLRAYRWERPAEANLPADCATVPELR